MGFLSCLSARLIDLSLAQHQRKFDFTVGTFFNVPMLLFPLQGADDLMLWSGIYCQNFFLPYALFEWSVHK
jgi:hypothetical protein